MTLSQKIKSCLPFILLFALLFLLWRELFYAKPNELPSALVGQSVPAFILPNLLAPQQTFSQKDLLGRVSLLNVWATWCYACSVEHPMLMKIKDQYHVPIYSIAYKDDANEAKKWLQQNGNPYVLTGHDSKGDAAIDLGVYGTPETYVISPEGKIIYRHIGVINQQNWEEVIYPLVKKYL
jgi:cytochrome c biogenesis protein CcmG, thiol:disulfide interchange protein DsbE